MRASVTVGALEAVVIGAALVIGGVVLVVQQFDGNVLPPTLVATSTRLHPIATILALAH